MGATPTYSIGPGSTASGTSSPQSGRAIYLGDNCVKASMFIQVTGGNATVVLECTGGNVDTTTGEPTSQWVDVTGGSGYALTPTTPVAKDLPSEAPYWRCRITALDPGASVLAYVPSIRSFNGDFIKASYPPLSSGPQFTGITQ